MFNPAEVEELAARKRILAAESDLNRQAFKLELSRLRASAAKIEHFFSLGRTAYPVVLAAAPLAGYIFASKARPVAKILKSAVWGWQVLRKLKPFWGRGRQPKYSDSTPPGPENY
jgi:hypothetical protein